MYIYLCMYIYIRYIYIYTCMCVRVYRVYPNPKPLAGRPAEQTVVLASNSKFKHGTR